MSAPKFPNDENGVVLKRMYDGGDTLSKPRVIDFCFVFSERRQALAFADLVDGLEFEVCISFYEERQMWGVAVKRYMLPTHGEITDLELQLSKQAESVGGEADGWGCMQVDSE